MRKLQRPNLPALTQAALDRKQTDADATHAGGTLNIEAFWKSARQTKPIKAALGVLNKMAGNRQRCMYCVDSHGTDMDHFWPKKRYPERMFRWPNLFLCCTECGRFKGDDFPLENGSSLLADPTADDPWQFLDFDPVTGNIVARFDLATNDWMTRGIKTVEVFHLDCREALAASYQQTHRRLTALVATALQQPSPNANTLATELRHADDHGLLGWCLTGTGQCTEPFTSLRRDHPTVWRSCVQSLGR